jgi:hypothetical protein
LTIDRGHDTADSRADADRPHLEMDRNRTGLSPEAQAVLRTLSRLGPGFGLAISDATEAVADELIRRGLVERAGGSIRIGDRAAAAGSGGTAADGNAEPN